MAPDTSKDCGTRLAKEYGPVFTLQLGVAIVLHGYKAVKEALIDHGDKFAGRGPLPIIDFIYNGLGIGVSNGERWKQMRCFILMALKNFGMGKRSIEEKVQEEAKHLVEELKKIRGLPCDPVFILGYAPCNVICSTIFQKHFEYHDKKFIFLFDLLEENDKTLNSMWIQIYNSFPYLLYYLPGSHHKIIKNFHLLHEFILEEVKEHQRTLDSSDPRDFIDYFLMKMEQGTPIIPVLSSVLYDDEEFPNPDQFNPGHFLDESGNFKKSDYFMPFSVGKRACVGESLAQMELFLFFTTILQNFTLKSPIDPKDIDTSPAAIGVSKHHHSFELCFLPLENM
ncbi:cytochrome P450 2C26-like isoform X2 [Notamacropus eugenii]|uniref:cytochrome P450 2C26-like isoform X2 n=1 Tax=Notamacropus eugenii TaxID=9315 RepID=UPI003B675756